MRCGSFILSHSSLLGVYLYSPYYIHKSSFPFGAVSIHPEGWLIVRKSLEPETLFCFHVLGGSFFYLFIYLSPLLWVFV